MLEKLRSSWVIAPFFWCIPNFEIFQPFAALFACGSSDCGRKLWSVERHPDDRMGSFLPALISLAFWGVWGQHLVFNKVHVVFLQCFRWRTCWGLENDHRISVLIFWFGLFGRNVRGNISPESPALIHPWKPWSNDQWFMFQYLGGGLIFF